MKQKPTITKKQRETILKAAAFIKAHTSATERKDIAAKLDVTTRAQISNVLNAKSLNHDLLEALLTRAELNKGLTDKAAQAFQARIEFLDNPQAQPAR